MSETQGSGRPSRHDDLRSAESDEIAFDPGKRWWSATLNHSAVVDSHIPESVEFIDCSLREGEEFPDARLSTQQKVEIARAAVDVGFTEMEVGYAGAIDEHYRDVRALRDAGIKARLASHTRLYTPGSEWRDEVYRNMEAGADVLTFVGWASEALCATTPWLPPDKVAERISECVSFSKAQGAQVAFGLADCVRTPLHRIEQCYRSAAEAGADRVYVYDGMGAASPHSIAFLVRWVDAAIKHAVPIALHCHNDYGLTMANVLAGLNAGASVIDVVPAGLGDQTGITPLEQIAFALEILYGVRTGLDLATVPAFCRKVVAVVGATLADNQPLLGKSIARHQIDSHIATVLRGYWYCWENLSPEFLGKERKLEFAPGKVRRGRAGAIQAMVDKLELKATDVEIAEVQDRMRSEIESRGTLTEVDLERILREVLTASTPTPRNS
jgi:isopropylmalate/homocitrate/citramalate synthase